MTDLNEQLCKAIFNNDMTAVKYLVEQGVDITANNNDAIIRASMNGCLEVVKYLVSIGADVTAGHNHDT